MKWRLLRGNTFTYEKIPPQEPPLHARSSSIPRIDRFHMTSRRPCWCTKTKEWRPYWCTRLTLWELNSIFMQILSFVSLNQYGRWSREYGLLNTGDCFSLLCILFTRRNVRLTGSEKVDSFNCFMTSMNIRKINLGFLYRYNVSHQVGLSNMLAGE